LIVFLRRVTCELLHSLSPGGWASTYAL
jgi:hypothetical protein